MYSIVLLKIVKMVDLMINVSTIKEKKQEDTRNPLEVMDIFIILAVVMVSWMYAYIQTKMLLTIGNEVYKGIVE